jgi:diadenosine tetraphosphate (Ap4A) HIT family hydrolase
LTICKGCQIGENTELGKSCVPLGKVIGLEGGWVLTHSGEKERNYLGHLILQPKAHRMDMDELTDDESNYLGLHIRSITKALKDYWKSTFPLDTLERVYVIYFWETAFQKTFQGEWHLHIHLFPRTRRMVNGLEPAEVAAWNLLSLPVPQEYQMNNDSISKLLAFVDTKCGYK